MMSNIIRNMLKLIIERSHYKNHNFCKRMFIIKLTSILTFILMTNFLFSENIVLKDGTILKGSLIYLDLKKVSLLTDDKIYDVNISNIEYIIKTNYPSGDSYSLILLIKNDGSMDRVNLIKLTEKVIYYKKSTSEDLYITKLSLIKNLSLLTQNIPDDPQLKSKNTVSVKNDRIDVVENILEMMIGYDSLQTTKEGVFLAEKFIIEDKDFYEKLWIRIYSKLDKTSENLLWNLLERYSEKEKSINLMYASKIKDAKSQQEATALTDELKTTIISIRKEFTSRARRFIIKSL